MVKETTSCVSIICSWEDVLGFKEICSILFENLKTLILQQHSERGSENMYDLRVQNVCLSERKKNVLNYEV